MSVTFVTAFFQQSQMFRPVEEYFERFYELASSGIEILLFLEDGLQEQGSEVTKRFPNVRIPEYITLDRSIIPDGVILPAHRHPQKDTAEYFCVQLQKLRVLHLAKAYTERPYLAWIDFGITRVLKQKELVKDRLRVIELSTFQTSKIYSGSCWDRKPYDIWNSICWRFVGGFLLGHRDLITPAYEEQIRLCFENHPRFVWEVNYWTLMDDYFLTYPSNHDDSILLNVPIC